MTETWPWVVALPLAVFLLTVLAVRASFPLLERLALVDHPNHRSSHSQPTLRGGGAAMMLVMLLAWLVLSLAGPVETDGMLAVVVATAGLALVSLVDDRRSLPVLARLAAHGVAVALGLAALDGPVLQGLVPLWLDRLFAALAWIIFVNFFNFMDGIDGITGVEAGSIGCGLALVLAGQGLALPSLALAAGAAGFLCWNWAPARVFLGDAGSIPIGYALGWLLLATAASGTWAPALILPFYYLADAGLTLLRRILRGEAFWRAHREHFYQRAVANGLGHAAAARAILVTNVALVALAWAASRFSPWWPLAVAVLAVATLLAYFARAAQVDGRAA